MPYQILLGERAHLIEFPSILLPPGATTGSIVSIAVHQNHTEEKRRENEFWALQDEILNTYGKSSPETPKLSVRIYFTFEKRRCSYLALPGPQRHPNLSHLGMASPQSSDSQTSLSRYLSEWPTPFSSPLAYDQHIYKTLRNGNQHRILLPTGSTNISGDISIQHTSRQDAHHD
jgi:hypothetical protein